MTAATPQLEPLNEIGKKPKPGNVPLTGSIKRKCFKLGNGLRRFPVDKAIGFSNTYPLDGALFKSSTYFVKLTRALLVILCN